MLNLLPSGILRPDVVCVMGNGMVIDPHHLDGEINKLREQGISITPANLKKNLLLCCITRGSKILIPRGGDQIQVGDNVIVVTLEHGLHDLRDIVEH